MPTIKNLRPDLGEELHDGRPIAPLAVATITKDDLKLDHYTQRIADGTLGLVDENRDHHQVLAQAEKAHDADTKKAAQATPAPTPTTDPEA